MKTFHTINLEKIKKITGASFVGFQQYQDIYHLRFVKNGKESFYKLHGTPNDISQDGYDKLLDKIIFDGIQHGVSTKLGSNDGV